MRVLLCSPPYDMKDFYPDYQVESRFFNGPGLIPGITNPLGLMYISSSLKKEGFEVKVLDGYFHSKREILDIIEDYKPKLVGINATSPTWSKSKELSRAIKDKFNFYIALGGPHIDCAGVNVIEDLNSVDFAVRGDAEMIISELCSEIQAGKEDFRTKGVAWKKDGRIVKNSPIPYYVEELDIIPFPDRDCLDLLQYTPSIGFYRKRPVTTMITSRGCKYSCSFCHAGDEPLRERSVEDVIKEFEDIASSGIKEVIVYDQDFGADKGRALEICNRLIEEDLGLYLGANLRIDSFDEELVRRMNEAKFWRIFYGIESGVQKNLDKVSKGTEVKEIEKVVKKTSLLGMQVFGSFIYGIPGETFEEGIQTLEFAKSLPLTFAKFMAYSPWPGSPEWEDPDRYGTLDKEESKLGMNTVNFVPKSMKRYELSELIRRSYKEFYIRPKYILKRVSQIRTKEDIFQNLKGFLSFIRA